MAAFLVVVQLLFHLFLATNACTEIRVTSKDQSVVIGRSMEYALDLHSSIIVEPKGQFHTAAELPKQCAGHQPLTWTNQYTVAYLDGFNLTCASDGMNTAGLSVGALLFPNFTKYQDVPLEKCGSAISQLELNMWLLGSFGTVQEVREALKNDLFPLVFGLALPLNYGGPGLEYTFPVHFSVSDKTGDGLVIEYTADQGRKVHENTVGIVTNSPPYDFHMLNLRNYVQLSKFAHEPLVLGKDQFEATGQGSGLIGMPGDLTPPSRFVRAAMMTHFADSVNTSKEAVYLAIHIMNTVDIPHGVISNHKDEGFADYTSWIVAKDLTNNALYFRTYEDLTIRVVYLNKVQPGQKLKFKVGTPIGGFKDVTDELKPASEAHTEL